MKEILLKAFEKQYLVSICIGKVDWDNRLLGYIKSFKDDYFLISVIDSLGVVIGKRKIHINKVSVIEINNSYNEHLQKMRFVAEEIKKNKPKYFYSRGLKFVERLNELIEEKKVCTIFSNSEYVTGIIKRNYNGILYINGVGYRGTKEGQLYLKTEEVTKIRYEGPSEKKISFLLGEKRV